MYQASAQFVSNLDTAPLVVRLTFADGRVIPQDLTDRSADPIVSVAFTGGSSSGSTATVGCAISAGAEIVLERSLLDSTDFGDQQLQIDLGMELDGSFEWVPMGVYRITKAGKTDDTITLQVTDDIGALLERPYEALAGFDFQAGVDAKAFVSALCARHSLPVDLSGLPDITLQIAEPVDLTERQIIAAVAGLWGKFACMDRTGTLRFLWYSPVDVPIGPDNYYDGECVSGDAFAAAYIKCYNSTLAETLVAGDGDQAQGLYFECPWCSQEQLEVLWTHLQGFSYTSVESVRLLGNPLLDPWDIVTLTDLAGSAFQVPIMAISHEYDGGMITEISAPATSNAEMQEGPVQREFKRTTASIIKKIDSIVMEVSTQAGDLSKLEQTVGGIQTEVSNQAGDLSKLEQTVGGIQTEVSDQAGDLSKLEQTVGGIQTEVKDQEENISILQQTAGQVAVTVQTDEGVLKTEINPTTWQAAYKDAEGNEISGLHFDFEQKHFVFNGSGVFTGALNIGNGNFLVSNSGELRAKGAVTLFGGRLFSSDSDDTGASVAMWGSELMVFRPTEPGEWYPGAVARMGFPADHPKYPYVHLGSTELDSEQITNFLIKRFDDGYWVGNALVVDDYGDFEPKEGCDGLFISTNGTFVVKDTNMQSVYTGEAIAKFG